MYGHRFDGPNITIKVDVPLIKLEVVVPYGRLLTPQKENKAATIILCRFSHSDLY